MVGGVCNVLLDARHPTLSAQSGAAVKLLKIKQQRSQAHHTALLLKPATPVAPCPRQRSPARLVEKYGKGRP